jgi:hypothetical protein
LNEAVARALGEHGARHGRPGEIPLPSAFAFDLLSRHEWSYPA